MIRTARALLTWAGLALAIGVPLFFAATSEYLAYRDATYIAAGFAGVVALALALLQPLLAQGWLPGLNVLRGRRVHRVIGVLLVVAVVVHVAAMWALFAAALLVLFRRRMSPRGWRIVHTSLVAIVVIGGAIHALLIEGTMEWTSKAVLCGLAIVATAAAIAMPWLRARWRTRRG